MMTVSAKHLKAAVGCLAVLFLLSGCAWYQTLFHKTEGKPAEDLARDGMEKFDRGKYHAALESFQYLRDWYPLSRYAILAELKSADAHFELKQYEEAIIGYEEFENLHPRNEAVPYVIYQIGRAYFEQMESIDRDQSTTRNALETFQRLQRQHPKSPYARKAREHIDKCLTNLASHDLYVGRFYFKSKHYRAARERFTLVLEQYPDVGLHDTAREYLKRIDAKMKKK
jgi:outer membrane protein assembly factor BamD